MTLRKAVFWCHLPVGVAAGLVVLVMSATGVLLAFERQIVAWADGQSVTPPAAGAVRLPPRSLLERAREARPQARLATMTLRADPAAPAAFGLGREGMLFVDPYRGLVLGEGSRRARAFFRAVTDGHRWLGARGEARPLGRAVTGACNLAFLFLVVSGFYLWWPRQWTPRALGGVALFRRGLRGKARDFNWHNVAGLWSAIPLFAIVLSAATLSYPWAGNLVHRLAGEAPPPRRAGAGAGGERRPESGPARLEGLDAAWARAQEQVPGWQAITLRLTPAGGSATFTIDASASAIRPDRRGQLTVDLATGAVARWEPYSSQTRGRRIRSWMRWVHTGEAGGWMGQALAGAASAGGALLVWTGLALACRRARAWLRRAPVRGDGDIALPIERRLRAPGPSA
jgi:uncharacterized iron-regulated membrane protein